MSVCYHQIRYISYKRMRTLYASLVKPKKNEAPYNHIIQIGDPTLRVISDKVPVNLITSPEIKFLISQMKLVFNKYRCAGLSAPQIGIPIQIFLMEFSEKHADCYTNEERINREITIHPFSVVINPEVKITDYTKLIFPEACESIKGFYADVPRYRGVELKGVDENGKDVCLNANGWLARIIQHEMDHLSGKVYTDIMDRRSLTCSCWNVINEHRGKVELPYGPD